MVYLIEEDDIAVLKFSVRTTNCLRRAGIHTIGALIKYPFEKISEIRNMGEKGLAEIRKILTGLEDGSEDFMLLNAQDAFQSDQILTHKVDNTVVSVFEDDFGVIGENVLIEQLDISVRARNCLINAGYTKFSQLVGLTFEELMEIKHMGYKTATELLTFVKEHQVFCSIQENDCEAIVAVNELAKELNLCWNGCVNLWLRELLAINEDFPKEANNAFLLKLYSCEYARNTIKNFILSVLKSSDIELSRASLFGHVPPYLYNAPAIESILLEMEASRQIIINNQIISLRYMSVKEFVETISDERGRKIVQMRLDGYTLPQIAEIMLLTKERVRQLCSKSLEARPRLQEDKYAYVFENYYFSKEDFQIAFGTPDEVYYYNEMVCLTSVSSRKPISDILSDLSVPPSLRKLAERAVYKDYVIIDNFRIKRQRQSLVKYFIQTYCINLTDYDYFYEQYHLWLDSLEIANDSSLYIEARTYENHIQHSNYVLWNQGRRFRYYNISAYDYSELLSVINLDQFENIELSSLKFFCEFPELMRRYDICDEYELHNLLRKIWPIEKDHVFFRRMPTIEIGVINRDKQVLDLLIQCAPISSKDFAVKYEEIYGIKAATVLGGYLDSINIYLRDGIYHLPS